MNYKTTICLLSIMNYTSDFPAGKSAAAGALAATQSIWMRQLSPTDIDFAVDKILFVLRVRARFGFSIAFTDMTTTLTKFSDARGLPLSSPFDAIDGVKEHDLWCFDCEPRLWMILIRREPYQRKVVPARCAIRTVIVLHPILGRSKPPEHTLVLMAYDAGGLPALFQIGDERIGQSIVRPSQHFPTVYRLKMKP
jgi:hypothetical protein